MTTRSMCISIALSAFGAGACKQDSQVATEQAKRATEDTRADLERTHKSTLVDREAFLASARDDVRDIDLRVTSLEGRLIAVDVAARKDLAPSLKELKAAREDLQSAIGSMRSAAPDAVEQARAAVDHAISRVEKAHDALVGKLAVIEASPTRPDSWLTLKVKMKLGSDDLVKAADVHVTSADGVVTLRGAVPSDAARSRALDITKGTLGVKGVTDELTIGVAKTPGSEQR